MSGSVSKYATGGTLARGQLLSASRWHHVRYDVDIDSVHQFASSRERSRSVSPLGGGSYNYNSNSNSNSIRRRSTVVRQRPNCSWMGVQRHRIESKSSRSFDHRLKEFFLYYYRLISTGLDRTRHGVKSCVVGSRRCRITLRYTSNAITRKDYLVGLRHVNVVRNRGY